jgi:hypothetical protein
VNADVEQQCFQIKIKLIQDVLQMARGLLGGSDMATIKDICDWIGIVAGGTAGTYSLFRLILSLGKKQQDATVFNAQAGDDSTVVQIQELHLHLPEGTPPQVAQLIRDPVIVAKAKEVLKPAAQPGYDSVSFVDPAKGEPVFEASKEEVQAALAFESPVADPEEDEEGEATIATGPAWVDTSHFRGNAKWVLLWSGARIDAKMPEEFVRQFQENEILVVPNAKLQVRMKITPKVDENGNATGPTSFTVEEVLNVELPPKPAVQQGLFNGDHPAGSA